MDKYKKLASNTIIFAIGTFSSKILSFLLMPFVTRMMTTGSYGAADLIQQTGNVIIPIAFLCVNSAALRFSMDKAERKSDVFTVGVRVTLVGFLAFLLFAYPDCGSGTRPQRRRQWQQPHRWHPYGESKSGSAPHW